VILVKIDFLAVAFEGCCFLKLLTPCLLFVPVFRERNYFRLEG